MRGSQNDWIYTNCTYEVLEDLNQSFSHKWRKFYKLTNHISYTCSEYNSYLINIYLQGTLTDQVGQVPHFPKLPKIVQFIREKSISRKNCVICTLRTMQYFDKNFVKTTHCFFTNFRQIEIRELYCKLIWRKMAVNFCESILPYSVSRLVVQIFR